MIFQQEIWREGGKEEVEVEEKQSFDNSWIVSYCMFYKCNYCVGVSSNQPINKDWL